MKKGFFAVSVITIVLTLGATPLISSASGIPDEQVTRLLPPDLYPGWVGAYIDDANTIMNPSFFYAGELSDIDRGQGLVCSDVNDAQCTKSPYFNFNAYLPRCQEDSSIVTDCIENVRIVRPNGEIVKGEFSTYMPTTSKAVVKGDSARGLPSGWNPSIWTFPGVTHEGGNEFLVFPGIYTWNTSTAEPSKRLQLFVNIFPISRVSSPVTHLSLIHI